VRRNAGITFTQGNIYVLFTSCLTAKTAPKPLTDEGKIVNRRARASAIP